jgi:hypothetical protein
VEAYLDESGIHDGAQVCVVAGFFGKKGGWRSLDSQWRNCVRRFDVPLGEFHAKDLMHRGHYFDTWSEEKRDEFVSSLAGVIAGSRIYPVSCGLFVDDFLGFSLVERKFMTGATWHHAERRFSSTGCPNKPYFVPFQEVLRRVSLSAPPGAKSHYFFGLGRPLAKYALVYFRYLKARARVLTIAKKYTRFGAIRFPEAKSTPALQAADLFSYLTYRHMMERRRTGDWESFPSSPIVTMIQRRKVPEDTVYYTRHTMRLMLAQVPLPRSA